MSNRPSLVKRAIIGTVAVVSALALASCSGDSTPSGGGTSGKADVAAAQKLVDQYTAAPTWRGPTEPVDTSKLNDKTVVFIAADFSIPFNAQIAASFKTAAKEIGLNPLVIDGKGDVTTYAAGITQAISIHAGAIVLLSIGPEVVKAPIDKAASAGIPVISAANYSQTAKLPAGITANVSVNYELIGGLQAAFAVTQNKDKVDAVSIPAPQFPADISQSNGQKSELKKLCPSCQFRRQDVQVTTFQQTLPAQVRTIVQSDKAVNWFLPTFDALNLVIVPAIEQGGGKGRVQTSSHNALDANLKMVKDGTPQTATIGENLPWWAYALVDESARLIVGQKPVEENVPVRMFTKPVLDKIGSLDPSKLFGDVDFAAKYKALWK